MKKILKHQMKQQKNSDNEKAKKLLEITVAQVRGVIFYTGWQDGASKLFLKLLEFLAAGNYCGSD